MSRFGIVLTAILLASCTRNAPSTARIKADYARIDPSCANFSIDDIEQKDLSVWVTVTEKCHGGKDDKMQLQYKRNGGKWIVVWYAPVLYD